MTYADLRTLINALTKTTLDAATLNVYSQQAENHVASVILGTDGRWQYDDLNYSDATPGFYDLVFNQQDYQLSSTQLKIEGVSVKSAAGLWRRLLPIDPSNDLNSSSTPFTFDPLVSYGPTIDRAEFLKTAGAPLYYDLQGGSILLYPKPDNGVSVTLSQGLKVYYQRGPLVFDYSTSKFTDGTGSTSSTPGFNSLYHAIIAYLVAYDYCVVNLPQLAQGYLLKAQALEKDIVKFYSKRNKDDRAIMTGRRIKYI